jgi:hypothetical protein
LKTARETVKFEFGYVSVRFQTQLHIELAKACVLRQRYITGVNKLSFNTCNYICIKHQWVKGFISLGVKRPRREADHLPPSSAEVKECVELYLHSPNTPSWRGAQLKEKHRDNFTFTFFCKHSLNAF